MLSSYQYVLPECRTAADVKENAAMSEISEISKMSKKSVFVSKVKKPATGFPKKRRCIV